MIYGLGFRVDGLGFMVGALASHTTPQRVAHLFRERSTLQLGSTYGAYAAKGLGFRVKGLEFRV